jgi:hypothetical protein
VTFVLSRTISASPQLSAAPSEQTQSHSTGHEDDDFVAAIVVGEVDAPLMSVYDYITLHLLIALI